MTETYTRHVRENPSLALRVLQRGTSEPSEVDHLRRHMERAEDTVSGAEAAVEVAVQQMSLPEMSRDIDEPAGRVARCSTCLEGQCFDCGLAWTSTGNPPPGKAASCSHRGRSCDEMLSEVARQAKIKEDGERMERAKRKQREHEEGLSEAYLQAQFELPHNDRTGWKPCPCCSIPINKSAACLHMQCANCGCKFCWRCGGYKINRMGTLDNSGYTWFVRTHVWVCMCACA